MPLTPFDVDKYRNGQPVITRDGQQVNNLKEIAIPELAATYLTAVINLKPIMWALDGQHDYIYGTPDGLDLFMDTLGDFRWAITATMESVQPSDLDSYTFVRIVEAP